ncbi:MAG: hypothetical protein JWM57_1430, partial [Phycisphaerales bacterium]|nr:hypothetical protein [Phycisphaerales bacterium]
PNNLGDLASEPFFQTRFPAGVSPVLPGPNNGNMPGGMPPGGDPNGEMNGGMPPNVALAPGQVPAPTEPLPAPNFQPGIEKPFLCWAYDETVVEGHTYRYQVVYALRNPVYDSNITRPPQLAEQFAIWSEPDAQGWGQSTYVPPTAEFYLATTNWQSDKTPANIKIDVFKWAQGKWQTLPFTVSPGDRIGDVQAGVDYGTNVTVVDLKYDPRGNNGAGRPYVLLLTADGRLIEREPTADRTNERMLSLRAYIQSLAPPPGTPGAPGTPTAPGAVGAPGAPGMPGMPGMPPGGIRPGYNPAAGGR